MQKDYNFNLSHVHDGDTIVVNLEVDRNFHLWMHGIKLRLAGLDCDELSTPTGLEAYRFLQGLFASLQPGEKSPTARIIHQDKYGDRWDAVIFLSGNAKSINDLMIESGHAVTWDGHGPRPGKK